jgi:hypothetical protein
MTAPTVPPLTPDDLGRLLARTDPAVLLVPPRILRRIIKQDRNLGGLGLQVPHRKSYVIGRDALLRIADHDELGLPPDGRLPDMVLLFPRPEEVRLSLRASERTLLKFWRLLFHARVHVALARCRAAGKLPEPEVHARIRRIGATEFNEARQVLRQERFLLPPGGVNADCGEAFAEYEEFAALYLELRHFAPQELPAYFPSLLRHDEVDAVLAQDVDAAGLFAACRPPGAPDPVPAPSAVLRQAPEPPETPDPTGGEAPPDDNEVPRLLARADRVAARGNLVRAAVCRARAAAGMPVGPGGDNWAGSLRAAARGDLEALVDRLRRALSLTTEQAARWHEGLLPLLVPAARGTWSVEARLLYDLQKVCLDQERDIFAADLVEWAASLGRRPVLRHLPYQKDLLTVKHLRRAVHKLAAIRVADTDRASLSGLLHGALHAAEHRLRDRMRPAVRGALDDVDLKPGNVAEAVSRDKLVEELLDRAIERNFLTMGDLRDALARNRLKLPDLAGPGRFLLGDRLIRANRRLVVSLDGVYRRGEVYLRWLQRLSSTAFGTGLGRFVTRYLVLPFGASYMAIKFWEEIEGISRRLLGLGHPPPEGTAVPVRHHHHPGVNLYAWLGLAVFLFLLLHVPRFRRGVWHATKLAWRGVHGLLVDLPRAFLRLAWVQRLLHSRPFELLACYVLRPLPWGVLAGLIAYVAGAPPPTALATAAGTLVLAGYVLQSRLGLRLEEVAADQLARTWHLLRADLVPGLVRWVLYIFRRLVDGVERLLYSVDEWLRFRSGEGRLALLFKLVLGLLWFCVTYVVRIVINLFVEPTFNPIKHFPVVTVTAKLMVPFYLEMTRSWAAQMAPLVGRVPGRMLANAAFLLLPGLAGFLLWELKENWRLYRANQSPTLDPEIVGHHGETVLRLLRPGLHSGTLPKLYTKLRRARGRFARRQYEALGGVQESLRRFAARDLLAILGRSKVWSGATPLEVGAIQLCSNRIRIELRAVRAEIESVYIEFEEHAGRLLAGLAPHPAEVTWLGRATPEQAVAFRDALAGFYKLAGVALVREQLQAALPQGAEYRLTDAGLSVRLGHGYSAEIIYPLNQGPLLQPHPPSELPPMAAQHLLFAATPVRWDDWVQTWQCDQEGCGHAPLLPPNVPLLPPFSSPPVPSGERRRE